MPSWLKNTVFYEIYPQSFFDTNADGIGDIPGIIEKLPYIRGLGCGAVWLNPLFDSPFKDAGYDVRDYRQVAPRYGTNEDLIRLFGEAHRLGMRVILDLVPGHTSEEHPWFRESCRPEANAYSGRYIWSDAWIGSMGGHPFIAGEAPRNGTYMLNFFKCQPALNYGFAHPKERWQAAADSPDALATRQAMEDVCRFWLERGCDGFRVDMADSLVKDDEPDKAYTCALWRDVLGRLRRDFPEAAFVSEWCCPEQALVSAGFDADFYLDHLGNGINYLVRDGERGGQDRSYFRPDGGDIAPFLADYLPKLAASAGKGYISFITGNHDTPRLSRALPGRALAVAEAFLLLMPGVPFLYYGDETGMRYQETLPTKEGGYTRTGSRTPMQWDRGANAGFSSAPAEKLYLPVDTAPDAPSVADQEGDPDSLLETVRRVLRLRASCPDLQADGTLQPVPGVFPGRSALLARGRRLIAVNPDPAEAVIRLPEAYGVALSGNILLSVGEASVADGTLRLGAQSLAVL